MPVQPLVGLHQIGFEGARTEEEIQDRTRQMIARSLNTGRLVAFVGSGVSRAYGLPSWAELVDLAVEFAREVATRSPRGVLFPPRGKRKGQVREAALSPADRALVVLNLCAELAAEAGRGADLRAYLAQEFRKRAARSGPPTLDRDPLATLISRLGVRRFLTTNYDVEIEKAFARVLGSPDPTRELWEPAGPGWPKDVSQPAADRTAGPRACSLMVDPDHPEVLVQFALGAPGFERGVFHCHGVAHRPASMVLTEEDYQRAYLRDDATHRYYRDALNIAFAANPILFVGTGLQEPDLLRPLREFVSERPRGARERPLFALYPWDARRALRERKRAELQKRAELREYLYARFGVKVLYYDVTGKDPTPHLCRELERLADAWSSWWMQWQEKPHIRTATFGKPNANIMIRHHIQTGTGVMPDADFEAAKELLGSRGPTGLVIVGRPGTGKGSLGAQLVNKLEGYERRFYATMHFTNELLSTIDGAASFLGPAAPGAGPSASSAPSAHPNDPIERLCQALRSGRHLLVIGGLERLLTHASLPEADERGVAAAAAGDDDADALRSLDHPVGRPLTREVERLLERVAETLALPDTKSDVVFLSSMTPVLPAVRERAAPPTAVRQERPGRPSTDAAVQQPTAGASPASDTGVACYEVLRLRGVGLQELQHRKHFASLPKDLVSQLHFTLRGHRYALEVIETTLAEMSKQEPKRRAAWLGDTVARLTSFGLAARPRRAVEFCLDWYQRAQGPLERTEALVVQQVALLATPISMSVIRRLCVERLDDDADARVDRAVENLTRRRLLLRVVGHASDSTRKDKIPDRFTAHTLVRSHVLTQLGSVQDIPGEPHRFELTGFSIEAEDPAASTLPGHEETARTVDRLLVLLERSTTRKPDDWGQRDLIRAVFGLVRSRWSAAGISRLARLPEESRAGRRHPHYDAYQRRLARLLNIVRRVSGQGGKLWLTDEHVDPRWPKGLLYADELAWLYNEIGLVAYCQGFLYDAYALFRLVQHVVAVAEQRSLGHRWCESELSVALVQIDRARLPRARFHLENALKRAAQLRDRGIEARARGYLGLVLHLSGNAELALEHYNRAIKHLYSTENQRGLSIFLRHRADLYRTLEDGKRAFEDIQASIRAADNGRHVDLIQYARVAEANLRVTQASLRVSEAARAGEGPGAQEVLRPALECARRLGIPKLEADAYKVQGHIALHNGETELAERLARSSLRLASALGMRLRVTSGLIFLGKVARVRGNRQAAIDLLQSGIELAQRQGYHLQVEAAERELMALDSPAGAVRRGA